MQDLPWWMEEAARSMQRKAAARRVASGVDPGDTFLIVTEGSVTEPLYFQRLRNELKLSAVEIHVQPGDASHPLHVIATAVRIAAERKIEMKKHRENQSFCKTSFDHVWAVIDTDVAVRDGIWDQVKAAADTGNVTLASSTPCFEYWLMLHLNYSTAPIEGGAAAKAALKTAGFDCASQATAAVSVPQLIHHWPQAVKHAVRVRKHHFSGRTPDPANPSTAVDLLLQALDDSLPAPRRRL
jgi:hypothetical protein